jgi:ATP adenylyltransferase
MVVPWRHSSVLDDLTPAEEFDVWHVVREASVRLRRATHADGLNIGLNLGAAAGAGIEQHLHVHLVPRWHGDHNYMPVLGEARVIFEYLEETWDYLRPYFADLDLPRGEPKL